jgi:hypothetical protein
MKTRTKILLGTLAAGALATTLVVGGHAQAGGGRGWGGSHGGPGAMGGGEVFDQADADKNGTLTRAEVDAFRADKLRRFDAGGDGRLSLEEFQGLWAEMTRPMQVRAFQFVDGNGDGQISDEEMRRPLDAFVDRLDRNDDDSVARDELRGPGRHGRRDG